MKTESEANIEHIEDRLAQLEHGDIKRLYQKIEFLEKRIELMNIGITESFTIARNCTEMVKTFVGNMEIIGHERKRR